MRYTLKKSSLEGVLFFLLGLFACVGVVKVYLGPLDLTLFNLVFYMLLIVFVINSNKQRRTIIRVNILSRFIIAYTLITLISTAINITLPSEWVNANITTAINNILFLTFYLFYDNKNRKKNKESFLRGLLLNIRIQVIWGYIQYSLSRIVGVNINNILFSGYSEEFQRLATRYVTGLHWERAYFCLLMVIGIIIDRKRIFRLLYAGVIFLTGSRTGLLVLFGLIIFDLSRSLISKQKEKKKMTKTDILSFFAIGVFLVAFIMVQRNQIFEIVNSNILRFTNMYDYKITGDSSGMTHLQYYTLMPSEIRQAGFFRTLFGWGPGSSGYPYSYFFNFYNITKVWSVDNGFIHIFIGCGLIGFVFGIGWWLLKLKEAIHLHNSELIRFVVVIIVGAITYSYFINWVWTIAFIMGTAVESNDKRIRPIKNKNLKYFIKNNMYMEYRRNKDWMGGRGSYQG